MIQKTRVKRNNQNDEKLFIEYAKTKSPTLKNEIAENNQALVTFIVNKYYSLKKEHREFREDLLQEGTIGLLSAIDGFDVQLGYKFSTYCSWWIRQAVNNYLLNIQPIIHVPNHIRTQQNKINKQLQEENKTFQNLIESNNEIDVSNKTLKSIQNAINSKRIISLEDTTHMNKGTSATVNCYVKDTLVDNKTSLEKKIDKDKLVNAFKKGLKKLPKRERNIILLRFDIIDDKKIEKQTKEL